MISLVVVIVVIFANARCTFGAVGGRQTCPSSTNIRSQTPAAFVAANCNRLTTAAAQTACALNGAKPTLRNDGASSVIIPCQVVPGDLTSGPKFGPFATATYFLDIEVVSSDTTFAQGGGKTQPFTVNGVTGFLSVPAGRTPPTLDTTQVFSATLLNKLTGQVSDPVYFTVKTLTCNLVLAGPSSFTVCIGAGIIRSTVNPAPVAATACPANGCPYTGLSYSICNAGIITGITYDAGGVVDAAPPTARCPALVASTSILPADNTNVLCFIRSLQGGGPTELFQTGSKIPACGATCTAANIFTQTFTLTAAAANANSVQKTVTVKLDPTCTDLAVRDLKC